jgi:hypothetical protein
MNTDKDKRREKPIDIEGLADRVALEGIGERKNGCGLMGGGSECG